MTNTAPPKAPRRKRRPRQPADAADIRRRIIRMASELSKMRSSCDFCSPSVELATHLEGALVVADIHHEPGCTFTDHMRENLISDAEINQAIDDEDRAAAGEAEQ